ncbi:hypothetical protein AAC387_Pa03g3562 [Persea americana]
MSHYPSKLPVSPKCLHNLFHPQSISTQIAGVRDCKTCQCVTTEPSALVSDQGSCIQCFLLHQLLFPLCGTCLISYAPVL